jgi:hypothetical protein
MIYVSRVVRRGTQNPQITGAIPVHISRVLYAVFPKNLQGWCSSNGQDCTFDGVDMGSTPVHQLFSLFQNNKNKNP